MTGPFSTRRDADAFDAALRADAPLTERDAQRFAALLEVVGDLRDVPAPAPRPEFVADLRERLMVEADTVLRPQSTRLLVPEDDRLAIATTSLRRQRRLATVLGGAALLGATTSMAVAAQTALPGDSLYPVKRAIESTRGSLAQGDEAKGQALLAQASNRLDEIETLAERGRPDVLAVDAALTDFTEQSNDASEALFEAYEATGDQAAITAIHDFTTASLDRLSTMRSTLPEGAQGTLLAAGERIAAIDKRAVSLCPSCGTAADLPPFLVQAGMAVTGVQKVITAASESKVLTVEPAAESAPKPPRTPDPVSGQDTEGIEVPDLEVPDVTSPDNSGGGTGGTTTTTPKPPKVNVAKPVNDATKLLTGDIVAGTLDGLGAEGLADTVTGVGTTVNETVDGVQGTLDSVSDGLTNP